MNQNAFASLIVVLLAASQGSAADVEIVSRQVAVKDYCAWPNVTRLPDGTLAAVVFNQPSHGRMEGAVECWTSRDGVEWTKSGVPVPNEPRTNRMNVACGLNGRGELVVLCSGWTLKAGDDPKLRELIDVRRTASARSADGGKTWAEHSNAFPPVSSEATEYVPFGDIERADDGSLRVTAYNRTFEPKQFNVFCFRSDNDGNTWSKVSKIAADHGETTIHSLGKGQWLAAARRQKDGTPLDLYKSDDDGKTWTMAVETVGERGHIPADFTRLKDGRLLLSFGVRQEGRHGVAARLSSDDGATWGPVLTIIDDCTSNDCGYPASVQLTDGTIVTGFYASGTPQYAGYQFATVVWRLPTD